MHDGDRGSGTAKMFGTLLRFHRGRAGISQEALARHVGYSKSQVAMVERGERLPRGEFVPVADEVLGAQGALLAVAMDLNTSYLPGWFEDFVAEEATAVALHSYQNNVIPGLLQTDLYARRVIEAHYPPLDDEEVEGRVAARLARQAIFQRRPAATVSFVLEMAAVQRPIGGRQAFKQQLAHTLEISQLRNVDVQIMPMDRESHAALDGPMVLLETHEHKNLAYVEGQSGSYWVSEQPDLNSLFGKYGILRAQALSPEESAKVIEQVRQGL